MAIKVEYGVYEEPNKVNEYAPVIREMIRRGALTQVSVTYPERDAIKHRNLISRAANDENRTASFIERDVATGNTGELKATFRLVPRHKSRASKNGPVVVTHVDDAVSPVDETESVEAIEDAVADDTSANEPTPTPKPRGTRNR